MYLMEAKKAIQVKISKLPKKEKAKKRLSLVHIMIVLEHTA